MNPLNTDYGLFNAILSMVNLVGLIYLLSRKRSVRREDHAAGQAFYDKDGELINSTSITRK